jgi:regulator of replication initiation timing
MLKQTTDDPTQTQTQKKFNIRNFPATKANESREQHQEQAGEREKLLIFAQNTFHLCRFFFDFKYLL